MALLEKKDCHRSEFPEEHPVRYCVEYNVK